MYGQAIFIDVASGMGHRSQGAAPPTNFLNAGLGKHRLVAIVQLRRDPPLLNPKPKRLIGHAKE